MVDRFEGETAVVEVDGGGTLDLPRWLLPPDAREGDHLVVRGEGSRVEISLDPAATGAARAEAQATVERLKRRDPGGDLAL